MRRRWNTHSGRLPLSFSLARSPPPLSLLFLSFYRGRRVQTDITRYYAGTLARSRCIRQETRRGVVISRRPASGAPRGTPAGNGEKRNALLKMSDIERSGERAQTRTNTRAISFVRARSIGAIFSEEPLLSDVVGALSLSLSLFLSRTRGQYGIR